jgi:hypothetical protein
MNSCKVCPCLNPKKVFRMMTMDFFAFSLMIVSP